MKNKKNVYPGHDELQKCLLYENGSQPLDIEMLILLLA